MDPGKTFGDWMGEPAAIDDLDRKILDELRRDARLSARAIAKQLGKSPGSILERIARLERESVVTGYVAQIDPARIGIGMLAIVGVQAEHDASLAELVRRVLSIPECERVYVVTGDLDLLVHLQVRNQHHLAEVLFGELWKSSGFRHSETMVVLHQSANVVRKFVPGRAQTQPRPSGTATGRKSVRRRPAR